MTQTSVKGKVTGMHMWKIVIVIVIVVAVAVMRALKR